MSENTVALQVENLSKKFSRDLKRSMIYGSYTVLRDFFRIPSNEEKLRKTEFWALKDINFEIKKGETLGLVGSNGSGKSTLLRIIAGIYPPEKGKVSVRGRVGALIALGAGFHPHFTGLENIYLNGSILGMTKEEIDSKLDDIVQFAEIGQFLHSPVSTYSSGMTVRLGFAIAIHSVPDIMLIDEILAVGDVNFQKKCFEKILEIRHSGVAILFVSHSISNLERMCDRGLLLSHGEQLSYGNIRDVIKDYMDIIEEENKNRVRAIIESGNLKLLSEDVGLGNVTIHDVKVYEKGKPEDQSDIEFGKNIMIYFRYKFKVKKSKEYQFRITIRTMEGRDLQKFFFHEVPFRDGKIYENEIIEEFGKEGECTLEIENQHFFPQTFRLDIVVSSLRIDVHEGGLVNAAVFRIVEPAERKLYFEYGNFSITEFPFRVEHHITKA